MFLLVWNLLFRDNSVTPGHGWKGLTIVRITAAWILMMIMCGGVAQAAGDGGGLLLPRLDDFGVNAGQLQRRMPNRYTARSEPKSPKSKTSKAATESLSAESTGANQSLPLMMLIGAGGLVGVGAVVGVRMVWRRKHSHHATVFAAKLVRCNKSPAKPIVIPVQESNTTRRAA